MVDLREAPLAEGRLQVPLEITIVPSERRWTEINDAGTPLLPPRIERDLAEYRVDVRARGLRMFGARQEQLSVATSGEVPTALLPLRVSVPSSPSPALVSRD